MDPPHSPAAECGREQRSLHSGGDTAQPAFICPDGTSARGACNATSGPADPAQHLLRADSDPKRALGATLVRACSVRAVTGCPSLQSAGLQSARDKARARSVSRTGAEFRAEARALRSSCRSVCGAGTAQRAVPCRSAQFRRWTLSGRTRSTGTVSVALIMSNANR